MQFNKKVSSLMVFLTLGLMLSGCGGGGTTTPQTPVQDKLFERMQSLSRARETGNLSGIMYCYSFDYLESGQDYVELEMYMNSFLGDGGRAWVEDLQGHEFQVNGNIASRRFTYWYNELFYGNSIRVWVDRTETFRLDDCKWVIYGNQASTKVASPKTESISK
jgi:hypothetical protein